MAGLALAHLDPALSGRAMLEAHLVAKTCLLTAFPLCVDARPNGQKSSS